ncbi:MAG: cAMP/cGMP-dependent 3',5'-cyclic-AMP/GMP phosphodiesterase [Spirochaetales bacterium]|nr:cAMP/cGMP-dependent 3',5'-cyclic-AMP/GMP phosphodiesterase [Leptospiraceae bacterium]MCP5480907.1 cAMP/cGMP-dependent 3',5'-cyclic-AMP/GMP phosphodiesterase [Spirochaetales bacterium]MCP5485287.1 cAMP/cGMP-dependent 3',5'-cyclic-AMP/GMP phosphodiesterase [Spirochaetales bacterium]
MAVIKTELTEPYTTLRRGGYLVETSVGYIQFGSPPETIKDTMMLPRSAPQIFVLPNKFFHVHKGISVAELEFPIYYNHFLRQKKTYIVCTAEQREQLVVVLNEAVFGPEVVDLRSEYIDGADTFGYPDMKAEMDHFRGDRRLEDLVRFVIFKDDQVRLNNLTIYKTPEGNFEVDDADWNKRTEIQGEVGFNIVFDTGDRLPEPYNPPLLGITCLGPSHGFDPEENTSGFLIWINHEGVMVDPPVNSTEWLRESNVNPKLISSILLTHCHADHDAGTFQKILEEGKITIYSTETVMHSFIRKYHALTRIPTKELYSLFDFVPVIVGKPYIINGAEFRFSYALHSIPSLSFEFVFQDQSFIYSSDHLNDPEQFKKLYEKGVLTEARYKDLSDFPWHHKVIYHEAGIPPLHTRIDYLRTLPIEIQKKTTVYHIAKKDMPTGTHLTLARFGIENTLYPPITPPQHETAVRYLDALANLDIFREFPISKSKEFLAIVEEEQFKRGDTIIQKDTPGDKFYVILSGNVRVEGMEKNEDAQDGEKFKQYGTYEYFGEASLIMDQPRSADVIAETDVVALTIEKTKFLNFIKGSDLNQKFATLNEIRKTGTWDVLSKSRFFRGITSAQKTQLELLMELMRFEAGQDLIKQGNISRHAYIIKNGTVEVRSEGKVVETLERGDFCGEIFQLQKEAPSNFDFRACGEIEAYGISASSLVRYIANNPGVYMRLNYVYGQ